MAQGLNWNYGSFNHRLSSWQSGKVRSKDFARLFGEVVRKHRKARFLTQEALAEGADLAPKMVSLIERYQRNPTVNAADSLAQAMEVPLWRLIKDAEDLRKEKALSKAEK